MRRVIVESPYAGDTERNLRYLRACLADCLRRGEAPFASHGLYTQPGVLDDKDPEQRKLGISAGFSWRAMADATVMYIDLGISKGMTDGLKDAFRVRNGDDHEIEIRELGGEWYEQCSMESEIRCQHAGIVGNGPCKCDKLCICRQRSILRCDDLDSSVP